MDDQDEPTELERWQFALAEAGVQGSELTAMLALARYMDRETLETFASFRRMAGNASCHPTRIKRGLARLVRRGVLERQSGRGRGNLTTYTGRFPPPLETGSVAKRPSGARAPVKSKAGGDGALAATEPVSPGEDGVLEGDSTAAIIPQGGSLQDERGSQRGSQRGSPIRERATVDQEDQVDQSSARFARSGAPSDEGPPRKGRGPDWASIMAKAFIPNGELAVADPPDFRDVLRDRAALIRKLENEGAFARPRFEERMRVWRIFWKAKKRDQHKLGYTLATWIDRHMCDDPPEVDGPELRQLHLGL